MNKNAQDVMMGAPSAVEQKQLDELHIAVTWRAGGGLIFSRSIKEGKPWYQKSRSLGVKGIGGYEVSVECFISNGLPGFDVVGPPDAAVRGVPRAPAPP